MIFIALAILVGNDYDYNKENNKTPFNYTLETFKPRL